MALELELRPLTVLRQLESGVTYAFAAARPDLVARGDNPEQALERLTRFLAEHLGSDDFPAEGLADYVYPERSKLAELAVEIQRTDLPRRLSVPGRITVPCLVVPGFDAGAVREQQGRIDVLEDVSAFTRWVHVVPLAHVVHLKAGEELRSRVTAEIERVCAARELDAGGLRSLLPAYEHRSFAPPVIISRPDFKDHGSRAKKRRQRDGAAAKDKARVLLHEIGRPMLDADVVRQTPDVVHRDDEIRSLAALLSGPERLAVALVGPQLAGKSAVVAGLLSQSLVGFRDRPVFETSGTALVAGQSGFGQLEERIAAVMEAASLLDAVLYFDDLGDLFAGHSGSIEDLAALMRPYLAEGKVRVFGEISPDDLETYEKRHVGFFSALHRIAVEPLDAAATADVLRARIEWERTHQPRRPILAASAVSPLVELCERYLPYQAFPGKAVRLSDEMRAAYDGEYQSDGAPVVIDAPRVFRAFSVRTGIPTFLLREDERLRYQNMTAALSERVIGQQEAVDALAQTLCKVKARLAPPQKPLANFLFVGPTGVGKTEVAKALARFLFSSEDRMVRFDMSEYMDAFAAERLIRGSERGEGELTKRVRQQPFCVVLLDEIEKAHSTVFDLLLQVLGEGRLSDARGKTTYFESAIIIMTSNLGAAHRRPSLGFGESEPGARGEPGGQEEHEQARTYYAEKVDEHFRPEFVNRIDRVVPFRSLTRPEMHRVADVIFLRLLERRGLSSRQMDLVVSPGTLASLAEDGYSGQYGARALRRFFEENLVGPLSSLVSGAGSLGEGASLRVTTHQEGEAKDLAPGEATRLVASRASGPYRFALLAPPPRHERMARNTLERIGELRRAAAFAVGVPAVVETRERIASLVAQMNAAAMSQAQTAQKAATDGLLTQHELQSRLTGLGFDAAVHARLADAVAKIDVAHRALEDLEDLAVLAAQDAKPLEEYGVQARDAAAEFERTYVDALVRCSERDETSILVQTGDRPECTMKILPALLTYLERLRCVVTIHLRLGCPLDKQDPEGGWPTSGNWGPGRTSKWLDTRLVTAMEDTWTHSLNAVLIRVRGPGLGARFAPELGMWRLALGEGRAAHARLIQMAPEYDLEMKVLQGEAMKIPAVNHRDKLARLSVVREFEEAYVQAAVSQKMITLRIPGIRSYFEQHEHVLFSVLMPFLMAGGTFADLGRTT